MLRPISVVDMHPTAARGRQASTAPSMGEEAHATGVPTRLGVRVAAEGSTTHAVPIWARWP